VPPASGPRILVVDDDAWILRMVTTVLEKRGYQVTTAQDGEEGLAQAQAASPDLIITDVMMPKLDGWQLVKQLRAMPDYADTPIVMVTSMGERIDRVRGFDAGVDEYITKPHDRSMLLRIVRKLLGHAAAAPDGPEDHDDPPGDGAP